MIFTDQTRRDLVNAVQESRNNDELGIDDFRVINQSIRLLDRNVELADLDLTDLDISEDHPADINVLIALDFFGLDR